MTTVYAPYPTGTMLIPSGASGNHLFVVMTNECPDGQHLLLSVSSIKAGVAHDTACVFAGGEHSFIKQPSFVFYRSPDRRRADNITSLVGKGYFNVKDDLAEVHFAKMCAGVRTSKFASPATRSYFESNCRDTD